MFHLSTTQEMNRRVDSISCSVNTVTLTRGAEFVGLYEQSKHSKRIGSDFFNSILIQHLHTLCTLKVLLVSVIIPAVDTGSEEIPF